MARLRVSFEHEKGGIVAPLGDFPFNTENAAVGEHRFSVNHAEAVKLLFQAASLRHGVDPERIMFDNTVQLIFEVIVED